jgi:putative transposase
VQRNLAAARPDQLWVCDLTYIRASAGFAYLALVIDVFSRRIVGWALAGHLRTELPLEALELAVWTRQQPQFDGLVQHTDAGSVGDALDNALAESTIGQLQAELVHRRGPWRTIEQLEFALFEYIDWWNHHRLHGEIGMISPIQKETTYHRQTRPLQPAGSQ